MRPRMRIFYKTREYKEEMNKKESAVNLNRRYLSAAFVYRHPAALPSMPQNEALSLGRSPGW